MENKFRPELIFGLVGPIGVDWGEVQAALISNLQAVDYKSHVVHLTKLLPDIAGLFEHDSEVLDSYEKKIAFANKLRTASGADALLAAVAALQIKNKRASENLVKNASESSELPLDQTAHIIRQLKRDEELLALRQTYGKRFVQISIVLSSEVQQSNLENKLAKENPGLSDSDRLAKVRDLIETDKEQKDDDHGQRFSEAFHTGDVFISGNSPKEIQDGIKRFILAFFGKNDHSPSIDEFGSYVAKGASLRSADLSRQVGSAIVSKSGDLITVGFNDVPKSGGGNYWFDDDPKHRDIDDKFEPNKVETNRIIFDFLEILKKSGKISDEPEDIQKDPAFQKEIKDALITNITEYGRMTHAEMTALCDAARLGLSINGATIYVTTYPCHNCAKHLIAAGICRIVFIEPYPKSKALASHKDAISTDKESCKKVKLEHFVGISPRRYRDIFEKGKRRGKDGEVLEWYKGYPSPQVQDAFAAYISVEDTFIKSFFPVQTETRS